MTRTAGGRLALAVAGVVSLAAAAWVTLLALIATTAFHAPNPDPALDGDPCCAYPDQWIDVLVGGAAFVAVGLVAVALYVGAGALVGTAVLGRVPSVVRRRRRALRILAIAAVAAAAVVLVLAVALDA